MKAYIALIFCRAQDLRGYAPEVLKAVREVAGDRFKYGESAANLVVIGFMSDKAPRLIAQSFQDLWRPEQRTWVLPLDSPLLIDKKLMTWAEQQA